jgi:putative hydrolase of the HAD superfamily
MANGQRSSGVAGAAPELAVRAVFFDLVGTLICGRASIGGQYAAHAWACGAADADPRRLDAAFARAMRAAPPLAFPGHNVTDIARLERGWWRAIVQAVVVDGGLAATLTGGVFDTYFERLYEHFGTGGAWRVYPDVVPTLAALRNRGVALGVITNYDTRVHRVLDELGLSPLLASVTIPADVGAAKPAPAIFARALAAAGVPAPDAVYVGDSLDDDYHGARAAGLNAVLLDRDGCHVRADGVRRIVSLRDLAV